MAESLRTFLALELSEAMKDEIHPLIETMKENFPSFRFVPPVNWHLTLHFLGQTEPQKIEKFESNIPEALHEIQPFTIFFEGAGAFPEGRKPRILWVGIGGEIPKLLRLKQSLDLALQKMRVSIESRTYQPHLTVARLKSGAHPVSGDQLTKLSRQFKGHVTHEVDSVTLFKSVLSPAGAQYTPLKRFSFGNL